jgi:hypothetical protein
LADLGIDMILNLKTLETGFIAEVSGTIDADDYRTLLPLAKTIIGEHGSFCAIVDIEQANGLTLGAIWEDAKFDLGYFRKTSKIAFITSKPKLWLLMTSLPFVTRGVRFFSPKQKAQAIAWALSN